MSNDYHYIISHRAIQFKPGQARPELNTSNQKLAPNDEMYFSLYPVPKNKQEGRQAPKVNLLNIWSFTGGISQDVEKLPKGKRDVLLYIHGYDAFPGLKLDLLDKIHQKYVKEYETSIGKIIFYSWPSHGFFRKVVDDRANEYGTELFNHFSFFQELSKKLAEKEARLHLLVHSFGNQLLNGLLSAPGFMHLPSAERKVFDQIFLMAPDVPQGCINIGSPSGVNLPNKKGKPKIRLYDFTKLQHLGKQVHIFYDENDYLLYLSTKYLIREKDFLEAKEQWTANGLIVRDESEKFMKIYYILGARGGDATVTPFKVFKFYDVNQLENDNSLKSELIAGRSPLPEIEASAPINISKVKADFDYTQLKPGLRILGDLFRGGDNACKLWLARHRYFITGDIVVLKVKALLKEVHPPAAPENILADNM